MIKKPHWPSYSRAIKRDAGALSISDVEGLSRLVEKAEGIEDPYYSAQALGWIGRKIALKGLKKQSSLKMHLKKRRRSHRIGGAGRL